MSTFPVFPTAADGTGGYVSYYQIPSCFTQAGQASGTGIYFTFPNPLGSYHITVQLPGTLRK